MKLKFFVYLILIAVLAFISWQCSKPEVKNIETPSHAEYVGSLSCKSCHEKLFNSQRLTPHHLTSQLPDSLSIKGNFEERKNVFFYSPSLFVIMDKKNNQYFETLYQGNEKMISKSIDLVIGSGVRGQTYLSWKENSLYQLPIGYFTSVHDWANSPGFSNRPIFNRPITSRCLECHSTFFDKMPVDKAPEQFSTKNFLLGIDCEKCHGPGAKHVNFHQENIQEKEGKHIVSFRNFNRKQQLDFCKSCHGGKLVSKQPAFSFQPGDDLNEYFYSDSVNTPAANLDSHGNQYGMLSQSKCFLKTEMTCLSCHQVHKNERGKFEDFSNRCMSCHAEGSQSFCSFKQLNVDQLKKNCIQCHMPEKNSNSVRMLLQGETIPMPAKMHVHHIAVHKEEIIKYLKNLSLSTN